MPTSPSPDRKKRSRGKESKSRKDRKRSESTSSDSSDSDDGKKHRKKRVKSSSRKEDSRSGERATGPRSPVEAPKPAGIVQEMVKGRTGGVYVPPFKLAQMKRDVEDKASEEYQRMTWEALRKSINGFVNKVWMSSRHDNKYF